MTQITNYIEVVEDLVDRMRDTANVLSIVETATPGTYLVTVDDIKTIRNNKYLTISGTTNFEGSHEIKNVDGLTFKIKLGAGFADETGEYKTNYPYFIEGHLIDITNQLAKLNKGTPQNQAEKYPLVILPLDLTETKGSSPQFVSVVSIAPIICNKTFPDDSATQRKTKNFDPIITPLVIKFEQALIDSPYLMGNNARKFIHDSTDKFLWGREMIGGVGENKLEDFLDANEKKNLILKILRANNIQCN